MKARTSRRGSSFTITGGSAAKECKHTAPVRMQSVQWVLCKFGVQQLELNKFILLLKKFVICLFQMNRYRSQEPD